MELWELSNTFAFKLAKRQIGGYLLPRPRREERESLPNCLGGGERRAPRELVGVSLEPRNESRDSRLHLANELVGC